MPSLTNSASNGSLSRPPQRGDFCAIAIYRIVEDVPELVARMSTRSVTVDAAGRVWFVAEYEGQDVLWTLDTATGE